MADLQDQPSGGSEFVSVGQAAAIIGVDESTVRRWIDRGQLAGDRVGPRGWRRTTRAAAEDMARKWASKSQPDGPQQ